MCATTGSVVRSIVNSAMNSIVIRIASGAALLLLAAPSGAQPPAAGVSPAAAANAPPVASTPPAPPPAFTGSIAPAELAAQQRAATPPLVLDVRTAAEFAAGHVPGALNVPHDEVESRLAELERFRDRELVLYCHSGRRAGLAAEVLRRHGFAQLVHLEGDLAGWAAAQQPVE